ncbi:MAG: 7-cyano-7-deazaguanine synthase QueC [Fibrobacteria bacterium]
MRGETNQVGSKDATGQEDDFSGRKALVVFSGGQDSTTCLHWSLGRFGSVEAIFFDYGQRHAAEIQAAATIAARLSVPLKVFRLDFFREMGGNALVDRSMAIEAMPEGGGLPNTFVPGRNLIFLTYAASYAFTLGIRDLVTGVCQTDYSGYPDCRDATIKSLEQALGQGLGWIDSGRPPTQAGGFAIHTPLMFKTKAESVRWAVELGALDSLAYSHTCYEGAFPPCGKCPACLLRKKGFEEAGVEDPLDLRASEG